MESITHNKRLTLYIIYGGFIAFLLLITLKRAEAWPFSAYPMFSLPPRIDEIVILRLKFEYNNGQATMWRPRDPKIRKMVDSDLKIIMSKEGDSEESLKKAVRRFYDLFMSELKPEKEVVQIQITCHRRSTKPVQQEESTEILKVLKSSELDA